MTWLALLVVAGQVVEADLTRAREEVTKLQAEVRDKQQKVDSQVTRALLIVPTVSTAH